MPQSPEQIALKHAINGSRLATARLAGMKLRATLDPPRAAVGSFPYPGRTCAEWTEASGVIVERQMSSEERRKDAQQGSARLRDAIRKAAA